MKTTFSAICIFIAALVTMSLQAQTIKQHGVTYQYNGKNKRTPIGGVYIKAITANNGEVSDEKTGAFTLALNNLKMGSRIGNVRVTKQGMMVFNQQAVDEWSVRKDPLCLILCNAAKFQKQKDNLIAIGRNEAKKKYDKQLVELKKQNDAKQLQLDEYYNKLDSLEKEYQNALKHMDEYADVFARIDESEVDTIAQRAIEMFNRGEIEESIRLLESQNYLEKILKANRTIKQAEELISTAEQAKTLAEQDKEKYIKGIKTQIAGYKLQNEWDKAKELLKSLADELNTWESILDYAVFCYAQTDFSNAEIYYLKFIKVLQESSQIDAINKIALLSLVQSTLASLYNATQRYFESETLYKASLDNCEQLAKVQSSAFEPTLAITRMYLAILYHDTRRYTESETMFKAALKIQKQLAEANPSAFEPELAFIQCSLGKLYCEIRRYPESETMYKAAVEIYERLAKASPSAFESNLALAQSSLAELYHGTLRYSESEMMYKAALDIYEQLAKNNSSAFEFHLASTQSSIADLYYDTQRYIESEMMYKAALGIQERLAKVNPSAFEPALAGTQCGLASLYREVRRYSESETMFNAALEIHERLAKANPSTFEPGLAETQSNLAILYSDIQRYTESEMMHKAAIEIYNRLAKANPSAFEPDLALNEMNLAVSYYKTQRYTESEVMYKAALKIQEQLAKINPSVYEPDLAWTRRNLAVLYYATERFSESETFYKAALEIYKRLMKVSPQIYEIRFAGCCYWLGRTMLLMKKYHAATEPFKQSLYYGRQMAHRGKDTDIYWQSLFYLSLISSNEKDYVSAYKYTEELRLILKGFYERDSDRWRSEYSGLLVNKAFYSNLLGKFQEGERYSLRALEIDSTKRLAYTNLASAMLFLGKTEEAEKLYRQYKGEFKDSMLDDFAEFERLGIIPQKRKSDVERIKVILKE